MALAAGPAAAIGLAPLGPAIASIDLSKPFRTRSAWRFTAYQAAAVRDPTGVSDGPMPGQIRLCISKDQARSCSPDLDRALHMWEGDDLFADPHYLEAAQIVHPRGAAGNPLLLIRLASLPGGNGDRRVGTLMLAYDRAHDRFARVFTQATGQNNNQEIRYIATGPLRGAIVAAEPTEGAPFGYWITVNRLTPAYGYRQVLRFRSATRYGDGNPLAVIDSDMPNIQKHLGLWRAGKPLPLPASGCAKPRLDRMELWCG
jgi:hypothetical protein